MTAGAWARVVRKNQMYHAVSTIMSMRRNGKEREMSQQPADAAAHAFQEYTYKKITPCDACSQVLRGHTRQGLKCRNCKLNVHVDCQDKLGRCQPKSRLLRRQKSTSEIETRLPEPPEEEKPAEIDLIYQVLKQAGEISGRAPPGVGPVGGGGGSGGVSTRAGTPAPAAVAAVAAAAGAAERERERAGGGCLANHHNGGGGGGGVGGGGGGGGGTAGSSAASSAGSLHRRAGAVLPPQPHGPSQLRAAASSLTVGPVPHASSSGDLDRSLRTSSSAQGLSRQSPGQGVY